METIAGAVHKDGYIRIKVDGHLYMAHRLAWLYVNGSFPPHRIDHKNGIRDDNRIRNLREATHAEDSWNRKPRRAGGLKGCHFCHGKWQARIQYHGKRIHLGSFNTEKEAHVAYWKAARKLHGKFANKQVTFGRN
jgi:HNH endonuclease